MTTFLLLPPSGYSVRGTKNYESPLCCIQNKQKSVFLLTNTGEVPIWLPILSWYPYKLIGTFIYLGETVVREVITYITCIVHYCVILAIRWGYCAC